MINRFFEYLRLFFSSLFIKLGLALFFMKGDWKKILPNGHTLKTLHTTKAGQILLELSLATEKNRQDIKENQFMLDLFHRIKKACEGLPFTAGQTGQINKKTHEYRIHVKHDFQWFGLFYQIIVGQENLCIQLDNLPQVLEGLNHISYAEGSVEIAKVFDSFKVEKGVKKKMLGRDKTLTIQFITKDTSTEGIRSLLKVADSFMITVSKKTPKAMVN